MEEVYEVVPGIVLNPEDNFDNIYEKIKDNTLPDGSKFSEGNGETTRFATVKTPDGYKIVPIGSNPYKSDLVSRINIKTGNVITKKEYIYEGYVDPKTGKYIENPKVEYVESEPSKLVPLEGTNKITVTPITIPFDSADEDDKSGIDISPNHDYDPGMAVPYTGPNCDPGMAVPYTGPNCDPEMAVPHTYPKFEKIEIPDKITDTPITIPFDSADEDDKPRVRILPDNISDDEKKIILPKNTDRFITIETEDGPKTVPYGHNPTRSNLVDYVRIDPETGEIRHYAKVEYLYEGYYDPETKQYIENPKYEYVETTGHVTLLKDYANIDDAIGALGNLSIEDLDLELIKTGNWTAKYESLLSDVQSIIDFFEGTDSMFSDIDGELGKSLLENFNISKEELENIKQYVSNNLSTVTELLEQLKQKIIEAEGIEEDKAAKELEKQSLLSNQPREYNPCTHKNAEGKALHPGGDRNVEYDVWQNEVNAINAEIADLENDLIENKKEQESYLQRIRELNNTTIV